MTADEINRAIAEHVGWVVPQGCANHRTRPDGKIVFFNPLSEDDPLPNYQGDLNAMHEAEKAAFHGNGDLWSKYLDEKLPPISFPAPTECAPARARAEAFLRTIGKWVESKGDKG